MPPKAKASRWENEEKEAILYGFRNLAADGFDPTETSGPKINAILKTLPKEKLAIIKPHFSINEGGTKANNNILYQHYKDIGSDFVENQGLSGTRKRSAAVDDAEEEGSDDSGSISLGSDDTDDSMSGKRGMEEGAEHASVHE